MDAKVIKTQATQIGLVTAGMMGAHMVSSVAPIENDKIKALIPLGLGATAAIASKNPMVQTLGAGAAAYGTIKMLRSLFMGSDPSGTNGIEGIADNPSVRKVLDMLLPNLGSADEQAMNIEYSPDNYFEPAIVDIPYEEIEEVDEFEEPEEVMQMSGVTGGFDEHSLLGFPEDNLLGADFDNELYL